jgi:uncharacterized protein YjiS (DUF1127 family)
MKQQDCIDTIAQDLRMPVEPALGRLWLGWLVNRAQGMPEQLLVWLERGRQRRHLAAMDDHMLRDIGLSRADVSAETEKWFWQP